MFPALVAATLAGLATGLGALPALFGGAKSRPSRLYDAILGLGAGLMLSAATLGLLGHALEAPLGPGRVLQVVAGLVAGSLLMIWAERRVPHTHAAGHPHHLPPVGQSGVMPAVTAANTPAAAHGPTAPPSAAGGDHDPGHDHDHHRGHDHGHEGHSDHGHGHAGAPGNNRQGILLSGAMTLHRVPEGFAVGAAFAANSGSSQGLGILLAMAIAFQNLCEGLVLAVPLRSSGLKPGKVLGLVTLTGLSMPAAAAAGYLFSAELGGTMPFVLSLAAGALITLVSSEIIPETHGHGNEVLATLAIILGFALTILLRACLGH